MALQRALQGAIGGAAPAALMAGAGLAAQGRGGDSLMAHLTPGDTVIPAEVMAKLPSHIQDAIKTHFEKAGADPSSYVAGSPTQKINPSTGQPEFGFFSSIAQAIGNFAGGDLGTIAGTALGTAVGFPELGAVIGGGLGAAGANAIQGGSLSGDVIAGIGGGIGGGTGGFTTANNVLEGGVNSADSLLGGSGDILGAGQSLSQSLGLSPGVGQAGSALGNSGYVLNAGGATPAGMPAGLDDLQTTLGTTGSGSDGIVGGQALNGAGMGSAPAVGSSGLTGGGSVATDGGGASSFAPAASGGGTVDGYTMFNTGAPAASGVNAIPTGMGSSTFAPASSGSGSIFGSAAGSTGGNTFSNALSGIGNLASEGLEQSALTNANKTAAGELAPYNANGVNASNTLATMLGTNGNTSGAGYGSLTTPVNAQNLTTTPGYQFDLAQGTKALQNQLSASGGQNSGAALKAAQQFGTGLANTTYDSQVQANALQNSNITNELNSQVTPGVGAATNTANLNTAAGNISAAGTLAQGNTMTSTLANLLNGNGARTIIGYSPTGTPIYQ